MLEKLVVKTLNAHQMFKAVTLTKYLDFKVSIKGFTRRLFGVIKFTVDITSFGISLNAPTSNWSLQGF